MLKTLNFLCLIFFLSCNSEVDILLKELASTDGGSNVTPGLTVSLTGTQFSSSWLTGSGGPFTSLVADEISGKLIEDPNGGAYLAFITSSGIIEANGSRDLVLIRYSQTGAIEWTRHYGQVSMNSGTGYGDEGLGTSVANSIFEIFNDDGSLTLVTSTRTHAFDTLDGQDILLINISKTDGSINWGKQLGQTVSNNNSTEQVYGAHRVGNNIFVVGQTNGDFGGDGNSTSLDIFMAKLDMNGNLISSHQVIQNADATGATGSDRVYSSAVTSDGIILGAYGVQKLFSASGDTSYKPTLVKFDFNFTQQWAYAFGDTDPAGVGIVDGDRMYQFYSIVVDSSNNIYAGGKASSGTGVLAFKEDCSHDCSVVLSVQNDGTPRWLSHIGDTTTGTGDFVGNTAGHEISAIAVNSDGVYFTGHTQGTLLDTKSGLTDTSVFVGKINKDTGAHIWGDQLGTTKYSGAYFPDAAQVDHQRPSSIAISNNKVVVTGFTEGKLTEAIEGGRDLFLFSWDEVSGVLDAL